MGMKFGTKATATVGDPDPEVRLANLMTQYQQLERYNKQLRELLDQALDKLEAGDARD